MNKASFLLAAFYPAGIEPFTPVQTQKLIFLIQNKIPKEINEHFDFQPYDYGPFDKEVYEQLRKLKETGLVTIQNHKRTWPMYSLSPLGVIEAGKIFNNLNSDSKDIINKLSSFVRSLSFSQLVSAVYKAYPEMKENSVFKD